MSLPKTIWMCPKCEVVWWPGKRVPPLVDGQIPRFALAAQGMTCNLCRCLLEAFHKDEE